MSIEPDAQENRQNSLAEALRDLRRASGLSGERLALRCAMSQTKISRIERGRVLPSVLDVERILTALEVSGGRAADIVALARVANIDYTAWRTYARTGLHEKQAELRALESDARVMRHFLPAIPTGLLHVPSYAEASLRPTVPMDPDKNVERLVAARLARQSILDDPERKFIFLLTEQAVRLRRAGPEVMAEQVSHMATIATRPNVEMAILPLDRQLPGTPMNIFVVYDDRLVTVELFSGEVALRDPRDVAFHRELFDFFISHALTSDEAAHYLTTVAEQFMQERD